jgi:hypothetical protein
MQNAKDSFYMALRTRLEEAEAPMSQPPSDVFVLRWLGLGIDTDISTSMAAEQCEIVYQTCGSQSFGGLDRGRALSEMDEELTAMIEPYWTPKLNYAATPPGTMLTKVFWEEPSFAPIQIQRDRLLRTASVIVYSYQEQGE